jgi:hypothetical protein
MAGLVFLPGRDEGVKDCRGRWRMKAFTIAPLMIAALGLALPASLASAQDLAATPPPLTTVSPSVQVTPFVSIDSRGSTPIGATVSFPIGASFSLETELGYRRGEGDMNALHSGLNLLYDLPRVGRVTPYLATGVGLAQYGVPIVSRNSSVIGTAPRVGLEMNAGGGVRVPVDEKWGMRTDARWFKSFGRDASEHFRVSQGVSFDVKR